MSVASGYSGWIWAPCGPGQSQDSGSGPNWCKTFSFTVLNWAYWGPQGVQGTLSVRAGGPIWACRGPYLGVQRVLSGWTWVTGSPQGVQGALSERAGEACRGPYLGYLGVQGTLSGRTGDPI